MAAKSPNWDADEYGGRSSDEAEQSGDLFGELEGKEISAAQTPAQKAKAVLDGTISSKRTPQTKDTPSSAAPNTKGSSAYDSDGSPSPTRERREKDPEELMESFRTGAVTPRSREACARVGIEPDELRPREVSEFFEVGLAPRHQQQKAEWYEATRLERLREVIATRETLVRSKWKANSAASLGVKAVGAGDWMETQRKRVLQQQLAARRRGARQRALLQGRMEAEAAARVRLAMSKQRLKRVEEQRQFNYEQKRQAEDARKKDRPAARQLRSRAGGREGAAGCRSRTREGARRPPRGGGEGEWPAPRRARGGEGGADPEGSRRRGG